MQPNRYMFIKLWTLMVLVLVPVISYAQISLQGEFRPRTELRNGYRILNTADSEPAFFTSQRTRLKFGYTTDTYTLKISAQDVRTWGEVPQLGDSPNVNIHEAWAELNLGEYSRVKAGRQELVYDDHRLLGSVNWAQQARSHDALVYKYLQPENGFKLHIGGAYNQDGQNILGNSYTIPNYKVLSYLWLNKDLGDFAVSGIMLNDGFEVNSGDINYRYTFGSHLNYQKDKLSISGTAYLQRGDDNLRQDIKAYMVAASASYVFDQFTLSGGADLISGGDVSRSFNTLYATNHKFYGHMDYFLNVPADTRFGGLRDIYLKAAFSPADNYNMSLTYHHFALADNIQDPQTFNRTLDKGLGSEVDWSLSYKIDQDVSFKVGYSLLLPSSSLESLQGRSADGAQQWAWAMLVISSDIL